MNQMRDIKDKSIAVRLEIWKKGFNMHDLDNYLAESIRHGARLRCEQGNTTPQQNPPC